MSHMQCGRSPCSSRSGRATAVAFLLLPRLLLLLPLLLVCCYQLAHNVAPTPALTARGRASSFTSENLQLDQIGASFFASIFPDELLRFFEPARDPLKSTHPCTDTWQIISDSILYAGMRAVLKGRSIVQQSKDRQLFLLTLLAQN